MQHEEELLLLSGGLAQHDLCLVLIYHANAASLPTYRHHWLLSNE